MIGIVGVSILVSPVLLLFSSSEYIQLIGPVAALLFGLLLAAITCSILFNRAHSELYPPKILRILVPFAGVLSVSLLFAYRDGFSLIHSFWGTSFEVGTIGFYLLFVSAIYVGSVISRLHINVFLKIFVGAHTLLSILVVLGTLVAPQVFSSFVQFSPLLMLHIGAVLVVASILADQRQESISGFYVASAILLLAGFVLLIETLAGIFVIVAVLGSALIQYVTSVERGKRSFGLVSIVVAVVLVVVLIFGLELPRSQVHGEIRPSLHATELVTVPALFDNSKNFMVGTGPATFSETWNLFRPIEFNSTSFWQYTPDTANSTVLTMLIELGIVGVFAFLLLPLFITSRFVGTLRTQSVDPDLFAVCILSLFVYIAMMSYPVGILLFLQAGLCTGICISLLRQESVGSSRRLIQLSIAISLLILGILFVLISIYQGIAILHASSGAGKESAGDYVGAATSYTKASDIWSASIYWTRAARVEYEAALALLIGLTEPSAAAREKFFDRVTSAIDFADNSVLLSSKNFEAHLFRATFYIELMQAGVWANEEEGLELVRRIRESLFQARQLAPSRPEPLYIEALLEYSLGNISNAKIKAEDALFLKPNYDEVLHILELIESER